MPFEVQFGNVHTSIPTFAASCLFKASFSSVCRLLLQFHERRSAFWRKSSTTIPLPQFERDIRNLLFLALLLYFYYRRDYTLFFNLILSGGKKSESPSSKQTWNSFFRYILGAKIQMNNKWFSDNFWPYRTVCIAQSCTIICYGSINLTSSLFIDLVLFFFFFFLAFLKSFFHLAKRRKKKLIDR